MLKVPADVFRKAERKLYDYPLHLVALAGHERQRAEILHRGRQWYADTKTAGGGPGDPTAQRAELLAEIDTQIAHIKGQVEIMEGFKTTLTDDEAAILERKYLVPQNYTNERIMTDLLMNRARFYETRRALVRKAAIAFGLLLQTGPAAGRVVAAAEVAR